jgi:hypothetical protein
VLLPTHGLELVAYALRGAGCLRLLHLVRLKRGVLHGRAAHEDLHRLCVSLRLLLLELLYGLRVVGTVDPAPVDFLLRDCRVTWPVRGHAKA